jgi:hypothetical protein
MTTIQIYDRVSAGDNFRITDDGYLVAEPRVARTGIQEYLGSELGRPDKQVIRVYRPPEAVFAADAMKSYAHRPVTVGHRGSVTAKNWKDIAAGNTGGEVVRDGDFVRVPMVLMDQAAIDLFHGGTRELSMGYDAELSFTDGVTPDGQAYDAVIDKMQMNHLALVDRARGGESLRIGDTGTPTPPNPAHAIGGHQMATEKLVLVDGISIATTEQGAQAIEKLQKQLADAGANVKTLTDTHAGELARRDVELAELRKQVLTDAQIAALVVERSGLLDAAKTLHPAGDYAGKTAADIKRAVVAAKMGDAAIAGKTEPYIDVAFDMLRAAAAKPGNDPLSAALRDGAAAPVQLADNGQADYDKRQANAWKNAK